MSITYKDADGIARHARGLPPGLRGAGLPDAAHQTGRHHPRDRPPGARLHGQRAGHHPATLGYQPPATRPTPSLCTSVNHVVCHGIPNDKPLKKGDIVNIDVTVITRTAGTATTAACTIVGEGSDRRQAPVRSDLRRHVARHRAGQARRPAGRHRPRHPEVRRSNGFSVVREFCGHGIGKRFHEEPQVLHYGRPARWKNWCPA
jgi:methionyl aminopeptidase